MFSKKELDHVNKDIDAVIARTVAEGHRDHTESVIRYRAMEEAVRLFCHTDDYRRVMEYSKLCEEKLFRKRHHRLTIGESE